MFDTDSKIVKRMYRPTGDAVLVCAECMDAAKNSYGITETPPKKAKKLFDAAPKVGLKQGLSQLFICYFCDAGGDVGEECDWVTHDCGHANIIAGGNAHSHRSRDFRKALSKLKVKDTWKQVRTTLTSHPDAMAFWGFDVLLRIVEEANRAAWKSAKDSALFIHADLQNLVAIIDRVMEEVAGPSVKE